VYETEHPKATRDTGALAIEVENPEVAVGLIQKAL
jgi:hypothetical protein